MNGKDCLLAFADVDNAYVAAANNIETIRRSFLQKKKRRTQMIGAVSGAFIIVLAVVGFNSGNWFRQTPSVAVPALMDETEQQPEHESLTQHEPLTQHDMLPQQEDAAVSISETAPYVTQNATETGSVAPPGAEEPATVVEPATAVANNETAFTKSYCYSLDNSAYSSYIPGKVITPDKVGEKIGDATVTAGWKYADGTMPVTERLRCEIYQITAIDPATAICIKLLDKGEALTTDHYYVQYNGLADLSAVSDYIIPVQVSNGEE